MRWTPIACVVLTGCLQLEATSAPVDASWHPSAKLGVNVPAPTDATVRETAAYAYVGNGTFKLNLFVVDAVSARTAAEQKERILSEPGFAKVTYERVDGATWRFDYALKNGKAATVSRLALGRPFDCGVYGVSQDVASTVANACAGAKKM